MMEDIQLVGFISKLLETKILQVIRFKHGQIYSAGVSVFLGDNKPSRVDNIRGDISVNFSRDPNISSTSVNLALEEILRLQEEGPSYDDVSTILEIEQRAHENGLQENYYWLDRIMCIYQSRIYADDVGSSFKIQEEGRDRARNTLTPLTLQSAMQRTFPLQKIVHCRNSNASVTSFQVVKIIYQLFAYSQLQRCKEYDGTYF